MKWLDKLWNKFCTYRKTRTWVIQYPDGKKIKYTGVVPIKLEGNSFKLEYEKKEVLSED
jgi:hypothetical protein